MMGTSDPIIQAPPVEVWVKNRRGEWTPMPEAEFRASRQAKTPNNLKWGWVPDAVVAAEYPEDKNIARAWYDFDHNGCHYTGSFPFSQMERDELTARQIEDKLRSYIAWDVLKRRPVYDPLPTLFARS